MSEEKNSSEKKKIEEELKSSKEKLEILFEHAPDAYYIMDLKGNFIDGNKVAEELSGYKRKELIGKNFLKLNLLSKKSLAKATGNMLRTLAGKPTGPDELVFNRKDGSKINLEVSTYPTEIDGKKVVLGIARDISKRKEAEEREKRYLEIANVLFVALDKNGNITLLNPKGYEILEYEQGELEGKNWFDTCLPKKDLPRVKEVFRKCMKGELEPVEHYENPILTKNGNIREIEWHNTWIKGSDGTIIGTLSSGTDITERKRNEELTRVQRDLAIALDSTKNFEEGLKLCLDAALEASGLDAGGVYIVEDSGDLKLIVHEGLSKEFAEHASRMPARSPSTELVKKGKPIYAQHKKLGIKLDPIKEGEGLKAIAVIPIIHENKVIGCLNLASHTMEEVPEFSRNALEIIAGQSGAAISLLKSEQEKAKLQEKLKQYAKRLEVKVKKLEKNAINLTQKEKLVLYGIAAYPELNDRELSSKIKLKRSTITAIKHRLRKQNLYRTANIPNLRALGCELIGFAYGKFSKSFEEREQYREALLRPGFMLTESTDDSFFVLFAAKSSLELHKAASFLSEISIKHDIFEKKPQLVPFLFEISEIESFFDFAPLLNAIFELGYEGEEKSNPKANEKVRLSKGLREVLYALVKYPEGTSTELAKKLRVTRATIKNNEKRLLEQGIIKKAVIPNLKKLNCELITLFHSKPNPNIPNDVMKEKPSLMDQNTIVKIRSSNEVVSIKVFKDFSGQTDYMENMSDMHRNKKIFIEEPTIVSIPVKKSKFSRISFSEIAKRLLDIKEEI
jgi:PAS domain S-box-containing protein